MQLETYNQEVVLYAIALEITLKAVDLKPFSGLNSPSVIASSKATIFKDTYMAISAVKNPRVTPPTTP